MKGFKNDLQEIPLGKLNKKHIQPAYNVLTDLQELVKSCGSDSKMVCS